MSTAHAKLSASSAHRWLHCPGSVAASEKIPARSSFAADEGSAAHELAEIALNAGKTDCSYLIGQTLPDNNAFTVTREMAGYVNEYLHTIKMIGGEQWYERRVDFSAWVPDGFGTSDCIAHSGKTLYVIDLKYGKGLPVEAYENPQGILYALGAYAEMEFTHDIDDVCIIIVQPRRENISEWRITVSELLKRGEWIAQRAQLAARPDSPRVPSEDACQWCPAKATCSAMLEKVHAVTAKDFDALPPADTLTDAQVGEALKAKKMILGWLDAVEAYARERAESSDGFPGFKLVAGRGLREWADEEKAQETLISELGESAFDRKLLSVAKAEKFLSKDQKEAFKALIVKREGAPTLVPDTDPRPAIGVSASDFDDFSCTRLKT